MLNHASGTWLRHSGIIPRSFELPGSVVASRRVRFQNADVAAVFANYPADVRARLLQLRELIFETAAATAGVGELEETRRWGEPSYLTTRSKSGSLIRIHWKPSDGDRNIALPRNERAPLDALRHCIALALSCHTTRKAQHSRR
jgi:hypothetical protein